MWDDLSNWNEYTKVFAAVFAMIAPPIVMAPYLALVSGRSMEEKHQTAMVGIIGFGVTMGLFIFFGSVILDVFGISLAAFRMAGGLLLMLMALELMRSKPTEASDHKSTEQEFSAAGAGIVPLAIPVLAGPGAISTIVVFSNNNDSLAHKLVLCSVVFALIIYVFVMLRLVAVSERLIGENATMIFNKVAGLILCAVAFEFLFHGIAGHFPQLVVAD